MSTKSLRSNTRPRNEVVGIPEPLGSGRVGSKVLILWLLVLGGLAVSRPAVAQDIVVAVNEKNPASEMSLNHLRLLYSGRRTTWDDDTPVELLLPPSGSEALTYLIQRVFRMSSEDELGQYYLTAIFQQKMNKAPLQLPTAAGLQRVASRRGAVVLVDRNDPTSARKGIRLLPLSLK